MSSIAIGDNFIEETVVKQKKKPINSGIECSRSVPSKFILFLHELFTTIEQYKVYCSCSFDQSVSMQMLTCNLKCFPLDEPKQTLQVLLHNLIFLFFISLHSNNVDLLCRILFHIQVIIKLQVGLQFIFV